MKSKGGYYTNIFDKGSIKNVNKGVLWCVAFNQSKLQTPFNDDKLVEKVPKRNFGVR